MVAYRCSCGEEFSVAVDQGGCCPRCDKEVTSKVLQREELSMTRTIRSLAGNRLAQTRADDGRPLVDEKEKIGMSMGHFEIIEPLGRGGQGHVYRALDKSLHRYVAVKVLQRVAFEEVAAGEVDRLLQEAVAQARVTHPNIVTIYYVGKEQGEPFLAMELVSGMTISERLAEGDLDFGEIVRIALQLTQALQFSFELDVIHGDIKPSNVLLQDNGTIKLSDFGMARRASLKETGAIGGTPNYLAPEVLDGESPSIFSDMYAVGVMFYEMTFGRLPVELSGRSVENWIDTHQTTDVTFPNPWPDNIPERWQEILEKLLAKRPEDRYANYRELEKDLKLVRPTKNLIARRAPRLIAAAIDVLTVTLFMLPLQLLISGEIGGVSIRLENYLSDRPFMAFLLYILDVVPIALYTATVFFWRQSIGRSLMHIRVVNRYGLKPYRSRMAFRSVFRMSFVWMMVLAFWTRGLVDDFGFTALIVPALAVLIFGVMNLVYLMLSSKTQSIHDRVFKTSVVLDTSEGE